MRHWIVLLTGYALGLLVLARPTVAVAATSTPQNPRAMKIFVDHLLAQMTLQEKAGQLGLVAADMAHTGPGSNAPYRQLIAAGKAGSVLDIYGIANLRELQDFALAHSRLKIPLLFGLDVVHGYQTIFPIPLAEASSWNLQLIENSARIAAREAAADGMAWTYAPMVDVARDPRWGRVAEGAGEDPWLGSLVAAARVHGFQGKDLSAVDTVLACVKHFAAYGAVLGGRDYNSVDMSLRELLQTYLPPYRAAVDAGVSSIMTSFNTIADVPSTDNRWLLEDILRKEWGFTGMVVTDFAAIHELINHGVAANEKAAALEALKAGVDLDMTSNDFATYLPELERHGQISMVEIDQAVRRVLEIKYKKGLFADPYALFNEARARRVELAPEHLVHAREMARRSIVLLKNDPVQGETLLPLKNGLKLAVIGPQATAIYGSDGPSVSLLQGLTERAPQSQVQLLVAQGAQLLMVDGKDTSSIGKAFLNEAVRIASQADVLLLALGEPESWSGEAASRTRIGLPLNQQVLFRAMSELGKPIILVLSNGRPLAISEESQSSQAILETWFLGTESGHAIADVLFGDTNPSGKLTMTFPVDEGQIPIFYSELPTGRPDDPHDSFSSKYLDAPNTPLFPFGWGLSYSHFSYSNLHLKTTRLRPDAIQKVFVTVTNTGKYAGEETVQLYIHRLVAPVSQPVQLLRGFQKVFLKPGESREVSLPLKLEDLKYVDEQLRSVATPGDFTVMIGGNSAEVLSTQMTLLGR